VVIHRYAWEIPPDEELLDEWMHRICKRINNRSCLKIIEKCGVLNTCVEGYKRAYVFAFTYVTIHDKNLKEIDKLIYEL
tara:strand:+ start:41 stop:277 length:237 start_codon:yes stop_codon:yes gene_type:complete